MTIKCIAFDLDNTLWECDPLIEKAEKKYYKWLQTHHSKITNKFSEEALVKHRMDYMWSPEKKHHNLTLLRKQWMRQIALEVGGLDKDESQLVSKYIEPGFQVFWKERNNVIFYDGVLDMLELLSKKYSLGVITNGNASVDYIGIDHFFDFALSSEMAGVAKPDEDIFHQAIDLSKFSAEEILYVGDDPKCDILGPQKVGMHSIWYNPQLKPWPGGKTPTGVIRNHSELEDKIREL